MCGEKQIGTKWVKNSLCEFTNKYGSMYIYVGYILCLCVPYVIVVIVVVILVVFISFFNFSCYCCVWAWTQQN